MSGINVLVVSDTHGDFIIIEQLLENYHGTINAAIHLGDHARDMSRFVRSKKDSSQPKPIDIHIVNGNTDPLAEAYDDRVIDIAGKQIFITHGHRYSVKTSYDNIIYKAQELQVDACLFGHTHIQTLFKENDTLFMNPGSLTYPQPTNTPGYALLRISEEDKITGKLLQYKSRRE